MSEVVVVVGAGPVGLVTAIALARAEIPTIVVEAGTAEVASEWRGSTLHPPTLDILDRLDLAAPALAGGIRVDRLEYRDLTVDEPVALPYSLIAERTRFPFRLQYEQYKLLHELRAVADASPLIDVRYSSAVTSVDVTAAATATVLTADGTRLTAPWVVAADGSHSAVRRSLGIALEGETYPTLSLVAAIDLPFEALVPGLGPVSYWAGPFGRISLIRTPDIWRVAMSTDDPVPVGAEATVGAATLHPRFIESMRLLLGEVVATFRPEDLAQHQLYRSHQRVAASFRVGRVVLIGDAAHLSATTGGMGLNSGVHDAYDLARRLAAARHHGDDEERAVDASAGARRAVAVEQVQPATRANRQLADLRDEPARRQRLQRLAAIAVDPVAAAAHLASASMLDAVEL